MKPCADTSIQSIFHVFKVKLQRQKPELTTGKKSDSSSIKISDSSNIIFRNIYL